MTPSDAARDNAISMELKKDSLQQRQSGDWKISFTVQGADMDDRLTRAAMGTRFVAVLVEIGDDELPIVKGEKNANIVPDSPSNSKRDWRDIQPAQQAGIRCADPIFVAFLRENHAEDFNALEGDPAEVVRFICGVNSRSKLNTERIPRVIWHQLDESFQAWKAMEHT